MGKVIAWIMKIIGSKLVLVGLQFGGAIAYVIAHALVLGFVAYAVKFVIDQYNAFMSFVVGLGASTDLLGMVTNFLYTIGFFNAFNDVFSIFAPYFAAYLVYKGLMLSFSVARSLSNEFFKIGVLWQQ